MAIKIIENENGTVTEKTSRQVWGERKLRKFQKTAGVAGFTAAMLAASSLSVFAANTENSAPSNVSTSTMSTMKLSEENMKPKAVQCMSYWAMM